MGSGITTHRDLLAWQKAFALGLGVYELTVDFPADERFGLVSQLRRASVSVASNIAEGYGRGTTSDYLRFLRMARGSLYEIDTQLGFALELGYITGVAYERLQAELEESGRLLGGLIRSVERTI